MLPAYDKYIIYPCVTEPCLKHGRFRPTSQGVMRNEDTPMCATRDACYYKVFLILRPSLFKLFDCLLSILKELI